MSVSSNEGMMVLLLLSMV